MGIEIAAEGELTACALANMYIGADKYLASE